MYLLAADRSQNFTGSDVNRLVGKAGKQINGTDMNVKLCVKVSQETCELERCFGYHAWNTSTFKLRTVKEVR